MSVRFHSHPHNQARNFHRRESQRRDNDKRSPLQAKHLKGVQKDARPDHIIKTLSDPDLSEQAQIVLQKKPNDSLIKDEIVVEDSSNQRQWGFSVLTWFKNLFSSSKPEPNLVETMHKLENAKTTSKHVPKFRLGQFSLQRVLLVLDGLIRSGKTLNTGLQLKSCYAVSDNSSLDRQGIDVVVHAETNRGKLVKIPLQVKSSKKYKSRQSIPRIDDVIKLSLPELKSKLDSSLSEAAESPYYLSL